MDSTVRSNVNSVLSSVNVQNVVPNSTTEISVSDSLPDISIMDAVLERNSTNVEIHNPRTVNQVHIDGIEDFLDNRGQTLEQPQNMDCNNDYRKRPIGADCAQTGCTQYHISATVFENSEMATEPSHKAKRILSKFNPGNIIRASKTA